MIGLFINTISGISYLRQDDDEIQFTGRVTDEDYFFAVRKGFAEPNGNFVKFSADGEKKFFKYIKDKMTENGTLRNKTRKSVNKG